MITVHVCGAVIKPNYEDSYEDHEEFDFSGQDDEAVSENVKQCFFNMLSKGAVNVCCVTEDSQINDQSHLRWGKPYMFNITGNTIPYTATMSCDQISACWA